MDIQHNLLTAAYRFEKSLYDLIRGLRNHRGTERAYIQDSLRECRTEIKSQDMDIKATALLKLVYLEMYGHDMSWASFHILEVMSSAKYPQKRVGYLAAVQSFRTDTDVLMLATNLLKKDLTAPAPAVLSLPLVALPHLITPSLAMSLQADVLPRLTHSQAATRKKAVVTLYRFALAYPETLRAAWPRIKERLMDENEDPSVTAAIVNVVCELGWRRPQDFLPLAPRLFSLLVDGGNNWMAIKIIKLVGTYIQAGPATSLGGADFRQFATLTPLEPRLVRKLLPPLTSLIRTTPAMSLLYECINGIIQGGILENTEVPAEGEDIAKLCLDKLRGMIAVEGDPNLKYVALLALQKIVRAHPYLVSLHQDVVLGCLDDPDISIRLRALDLLVSMVDSGNLISVVGKLMRQLHNSPIASNADEAVHERGARTGIVPTADSDEEDPEESLKPAEKKSAQPPPLPEDYRLAVIERVLEMCSRETYVNITDFPWYIEVLVQLVPLAPVPTTSTLAAPASRGRLESEEDLDVTRDIGLELLNVAVRVRDVRLEATRAVEKLVLGHRSSGHALPPLANKAFLRSAAWIVGEYAEYLSYPRDTLSALVHSSAAALPAETLNVYLQAIPKVFVAAADIRHIGWSPESKSMTSLHVDSIIRFLDPLTTHPNLEVQERAVEVVELMRLVADAMSAQPTTGEDGAALDAPLVVTQVVPSLFAGLELNPVAPAAQKKVPLPEGLDLDAPINESLPLLLQAAALPAADDTEFDETTLFYHRRPKPAAAAAAIAAEPAANILDRANAEAPSYQNLTSPEDPELAARRRAERRERNKDDPFYIPTAADSGAASPIHNIIRHTNNGVELDIDSIPIMDLNIESRDRGGGSGTESPRRNVESARPRRKRLDIIGDETIPFDVVLDNTNNNNIDSTNTTTTRRPDQATRSKSNEDRPSRSKGGKAQQSLLQVDSSGLRSLLSLDEPEPLGSTTGGGRGGGGSRNSQGHGQDEEVDQEMLRALREVEKRRLEIQREAERIQLAHGVPVEGTLIKKKVKKKKKPKEGVVALGVLGNPDEAGNLDEVDATNKDQKKKKKKVVVKPKGRMDGEKAVQGRRGEDERETGKGGVVGRPDVGEAVGEGGEGDVPPPQS